MTNREIVLRAFSNRVGNLYKQAEPEQDLGGTYSHMQPDMYPGEGPQQNAIMKALSGLASGAKGYLGSAMSKSQDATMAALGRFNELDPTARAAIIGGLGGAGVGGVGNAVLGNKKKSLIRRLGEGAGIGAAAGAGAGALGRLGKDKVYDPIKEKYIDPGIAEVGRVLGKGKDKLVKGVGKAKDKIVAETDKIKNKAMGAANSAKETVVGAANSAATTAKGGVDYLAGKAKGLKDDISARLGGYGTKLDSNSPTDEEVMGSYADRVSRENLEAEGFDKIKQMDKRKQRAGSPGFPSGDGDFGNSGY